MSRFGDDISHLSLDSAPGDPGFAEEYVGVSLPPSKVDEWKRRIGTDPILRRGPYHAHGLLAAQRFVAERFACQSLLENHDSIVVDVGGAPHRTFEVLGERGRYMMPQVVIGDRTRLAKAPDGSHQYICHHTFSECTCHFGEKHSFLFTHSAYYIEPQVLWERLNSPDVVDAIIVEHEFDDMYGGFYNEANWAIRRDVVTMTVKGDATPYCHVLPPWQVGWMGPRGEAFEAEVLRTLDNVTYVKRIVPVIRAFSASPLRPLTWDEVVADPSRSGPVQFSDASRHAVADNARFTQVTFDVHHIRKFGPVLYTDFFIRGDKVSLTVPVNAVAEVATHVMNRPRTAELYNETSYVFKTRWGKTRIPPGERAQVFSAAIALGFVVNIANEMDLTYTMTERFSWAMRVHSTLLQFGKIVVRSWVWLLCAFLTWLVAFVMFESLDHNVRQEWIGAVVFSTLSLLCFCCCVIAFRTRRELDRVQEAGWLSSYSNDDSPSLPLLGQNYAFSNTRFLPGTRYIKPPAEVGETDGRCELGATRERVFEDQRAILSGVVLDGALPNVLHTTQEAEHSAVTNRVLAHRENPEPLALAVYLDGFETTPFFMVRRGLDTSFEYFKMWLNKLKKSYPAVYVAKIEEAWRRNQGVVALATGTKAFLKTEKSAATVGVDHNKRTKPRLIQPPEDVDKAVTGPVVWQLYEHVREAWNGVRCSVMYCSGYTSRRIGEVVDKFVYEHGEANILGYSADMAAYDSTLSLQLQEAAFDWYVKLGMPVWMKSWLTRIHSRGQTPNGVLYMPTRQYTFETNEQAMELVRQYQRNKMKILSMPKLVERDGQQSWVVSVEDFQMTSGRMDTNLTDTVCLVASIECILSVRDIPHATFVCGDDAFILIPKGFERHIEDVEALQRRIGLRPEGVLTDDRSRWEFCSKLFWWGTDPETGETGTVLGSKPFRGIARMGVNTTLPGAANAAQAALSVRVDSGHVPFLGPMADRTYELCREKRIRPTGRAEWTAIRSDKRHDCDPRNYLITQQRYGLGKENEEDFVKHLSTLDAVPVVVSWLPAIDAVRVDEA